MIKLLIITALLLLLELVYFKIADRFNIIDKPNERSSHKTLTLRGGGVIFLFGAWLYAAFYGFNYPWFLAGLTLVAGVSFIDDIRSLPDSVRLVVQFAAAAMAFYQMDILHWDMWWMVVLALIVYVGITNVYNFMDGINGITAGYSLAVLVPMMLVNGEPLVMTEGLFVDPALIVVAILSVLVFCIFNFRPKGKAEVAVLSRSRQKRIMGYVHTHPTYMNLGIYICLCTGLRIGEVCALKWEDIDLSAGVINVTKTLQRIYIVEDGRKHTEVIIGTPKTATSIRRIPLPRELRKMIRPFMVSADRSGYVLTNSPHLTEPRTYRNYYKKLLHKLDLPDLKFHGLRHSFATRCIESHCDYKTVSVLLGHSNISTTLNLYVHPDMEQKQHCVEQMFRSLRGSLQH